MCRFYPSRLVHGNVNGQQWSTTSLWSFGVLLFRQSHVVCQQKCGSRWQWLVSDIVCFPSPNMLVADLGLSQNGSNIFGIPKVDVSHWETDEISSKAIWLSTRKSGIPNFHGSRIWSYLAGNNTHVTGSINANSRILKWRYLPYIRPIFEGYGSGDIPPNFYGLEHGTAAPV